MEDSYLYSRKQKLFLTNAVTVNNDISFNNRTLVAVSILLCSSFLSCKIKDHNVPLKIVKINDLMHERHLVQ